MSEVQCNRCGDICQVDGDYPKYFAWCDSCGDYAGGFDGIEYATDYAASLIDEAMERSKYD